MEYQIQIDAIDQLDHIIPLLFRAECVRYPNGEIVAPIYSCPNEGARSPRNGARMKAMGRRRGIPDLFVPVASATSLGLYIEVKAQGGSLRPDQRVWRDRLIKNGYKYLTLDNAEKIVSAVVEYLKDGDG